MGFTEKFRSLDYVSPIVEIRFDAKTRVKTALGAVMTLLLSLTVMAGAFFFSRDLFTKKNPVSNFNQVNMDDSVVSLKDFPIFFRFADFLGNSITSKVVKEIEIDLLRYYVPKSSSLTAKKLIVEECTDDHLGKYAEIYKKDFSIPFSQMLCINGNGYTGKDGKFVEEEITFNKEYASSDSAFINLYINKCDNKAKPGCSAFIDSMSYYFIQVYHPSTTVNLSDYSEPDTPAIKSALTRLTSGLRKRVFFKVKNSEVVTDQGWILKDEQTRSFYQIDSIETEYDNYDEISRRIYGFVFESPKVLNQYKREYIKIQNILANLGGFTKAAFILMKGMMMLYGDFVLINSIDRKRKAMGLSRTMMEGNNDSNIALSRDKLKKRLSYFESLSFWAYLKGMMTLDTKILEERKKILKIFDIAEIHKKLSPKDSPFKRSDTPHLKREQGKQELKETVN